MHLLRALVGVFVVASLLAPPALAGERPKPRAPDSHSLESGPLMVPVEVAVGPIALVPSTPLFADQPVHGGLRIEIAAVVDRELIRANAGRLPRWARGVARSVDEVKVRPLWLALLPEELVISPQLWNTGILGAIWRPVGVNLALVDRRSFRMFVGMALDAVALYVRSTTVGLPPQASAGTSSETWVVRPGLHATVGAEWKASKAWGLSMGWASDVFVPQPIGRPPWEFLPVEDALFHLGGPFVMLHGRFRVPIAK